MSAGKSGGLGAGDKGPGMAGDEHRDAFGLELAWWPALHGRPGVPPWMRAELAGLRSAFPGFCFGVCRGWRGLVFEAWRDPGEGGLYAVITGDAAELRRELEAGGQGGLRQVTDASGSEA